MLYIPTKNRTARIEAAFRQYSDGCITYMEFVFLVINLVSKIDIVNYNKFVDEKSKISEDAEFKLV